MQPTAFNDALYFCQLYEKELQETVQGMQNSWVMLAIYLESDSIALRRKAVIQDANYLEGWEILFRLLERGWKYDEAIQFALDRPAADIVGFINDGPMRGNFSLNDFLDSRLWYLQGRRAYLNDSLEEATSHFEAAPKSLRTVVELAMCASRNNDLDRTNDLLCGLLA